jgi:Asp-tRNA(Asn)/Glu-tRNA(Gln) amidotransferase A subunit family amidase
MSVTTTDLWRLSAAELAAAIRSRQLSSQEVIEAHLRRIEQVNPAINAVTVVLTERAHSWMNRFRRLLIRLRQKARELPGLPSFRLWLDRVSGRSCLRIGSYFCATNT